MSLRLHTPHRAPLRSAHGRVSDSLRRADACAPAPVPTPVRTHAPAHTHPRTRVYVTPGRSVCIHVPPHSAAHLHRSRPRTTRSEGRSAGTGGDPSKF